MWSCWHSRYDFGKVVEGSIEDNMGTQYFEVDYMVVGNMVEDGIVDFD